MLRATSPQPTAESYTAPDIEIIDIELGQDFFQGASAESIDGGGVFDNP